MNAKSEVFPHANEKEKEPAAAHGALRGAADQGSHRAPRPLARADAGGPRAACGAGLRQGTLHRGHRRCGARRAVRGGGDGARRCAAEGLRNVRFIDANANILPEFFAPGEVDRIYINFCDPWPTKRHAKRRLTHGNFLKLYRKVLKDGGQTHFKTDNAPLFAWSVEEIPQFGFALSEVTDDLHANGAVGVMTDYEAKFHELGTPIHRLVATMTPWEEPEEE